MNRISMEKIGKVSEEKVRAMVAKETDTHCTLCLDVPASSLISCAPTSPPLVRTDEIVVMISLSWEKYCYSNVHSGKCKEIQKYSSECFFFF